MGAPITTAQLTVRRSVTTHWVTQTCTTAAGDTSVEHVKSHCLVKFLINTRLYFHSWTKKIYAEDSYKGSEFGVFYLGSNGCDNDGDGKGDFADGVTCNELSGTEADTRPKLTVSYTPNDDLTLFAVSSAGYRPGGNNANLPYFCENDPKHLLSKEDTPLIELKILNLVKI